MSCEYMQNIYTLYYIRFSEDIQSLEYILYLLHRICRRQQMIDYSPFWETLEKSTENWYTLTSKHHLSNSTLHRLKHNKDVSTKTLNDLCRILHCDIKDVARYVPSEEDQPL